MESNHPQDNKAFFTEARKSECNSFERLWQSHPTYFGFRFLAPRIQHFVDVDIEPQGGNLTSPWEAQRADVGWSSPAIHGYYPRQ